LWGLLWGVSANIGIAQQVSWFPAEDAKALVSVDVGPYQALSNDTGENRLRTLGVRVVAGSNPAGIGGRLVSGVAASLTVEVDAGVAGIVRRSLWVSVFALEALCGWPTRLDQHAVDREMLVGEQALNIADCWRSIPRIPTSSSHRDHRYLYMIIQ
jgi:hypothetical protein